MNTNPQTPPTDDPQPAEPTRPLTPDDLDLAVGLQDPRRLPSSPDSLEPPPPGLQVPPVPRE